MVKQITGKAPKYIRFPGGSSNTISAQYSQGIMSALDNMVHEKGYEYFDWNCSSGDAASNTVPTQDIVRNATSCDYEQIMILFHDSSPKKQRLKHYQKSLKTIKKEDMSLKESAMIRQFSIMESITKSANCWLFLVSAEKKSKELTFDYCFVVL